MRKLKQLDVEIAFPTRTLHIDAEPGRQARSRRHPSRRESQP
jgi:hypothetical protein